MLRKSLWDGKSPPKPGELAVLIDYSLALDEEPSEGDGSTGTSAHAHISVREPHRARLFASSDTVSRVPFRSWRLTFSARL